MSSPIQCAYTVLDRAAFERVRNVPFTDFACTDHALAAKAYTEEPAMPDDFRAVAGSLGFGFLFRWDFFFVATWEAA